MDILLDTDGDLLIQNGDLVMGDDMPQVFALLIGSTKGMWKQYPLAGIGLARYLEAPLTPEVRANLEREFSIQLKPEGYSETDVKNIVNTLLDGTI